MTTTEAVEVHTDAKPAPLTPQVAIKRLLDQYRPVISKLLVGTGVTEAAMEGAVTTAPRSLPKSGPLTWGDTAACEQGPGRRPPVRSSSIVKEQFGP